MNIDQENQAGHALSVAKARRPNWLRFAAKKTPSWFSGRELGVLDQGERDQLYLDCASKQQPGEFVLAMIVAGNASNAFHGLQLESERRFWIAVQSACIVVAMGMWFYRRWAILNSARRSVHERDDWPLRSQRQVF